MRHPRHSILVLCVLAAAACDASDDAQHSDAHATGSATSLDGPVACGAMECTSGQLCARSSPGTDAGVGETVYACVTVPVGCQVFDCRDTECAACVRDLCQASGGFFYGVVGRTLYCPGQ